LTDESVKDELKLLAEQLTSSEAEVVCKCLARIASTVSRKPELATHIDDMIPAVVSHLSHADPTVRAACCWAVGHIGRRRPDCVSTVVPQLANLAQSTSSKVREMAIWAMGVTGRAEPRIVARYLPIIVERAKDAEGEVRLSAIWACENIATQRPEWFADYLPLFIAMLDDPDTTHVRGEVPELFRVIGKRRPDLVECAISELRRKLDDSDRVTRLHAAAALKAIEKAKGGAN